MFISNVGKAELETIYKWIQNERVVSGINIQPNTFSPVYKPGKAKKYIAMQSFHCSDRFVWLRVGGWVGVVFGEQPLI